jgi:hypothetical protein
MYRATEETPAPPRARPRPPGELSGTWIVTVVAVVLIAMGARIGFALDPQRPQEPDSIGYARIAKNLYEEGSFEEGGRRTHLQEPSNYSPGLPLFVAGLYYVTGGVHLELARVVLAVIGALAVLFAFLIGNRLSGPGAGLAAAVVVGGYPALLQYQGMLMTEPLAVTLLGAALLAFLWAGDGRATAAWALPGLLLGLLAMVRPEYLLFVALFPLVVLLRARRGAGRWGPAVAAAAIFLLASLLPIAPWTVRNAEALDRFVPISTGGGKALFVGTYMPADGDGPRLREQLLRQNPDLRRELADAPLRTRLDTLLIVIAAREHPGVPTDVALARMGRENLETDLEDPAGFGAMLARKVSRAWREGPRKIMKSEAWVTAQRCLLVLALVGLGVLIATRRWEAAPIALLLLGVAATSALLIASPRRVVVILPVLGALAGTAVAWLVRQTRELT